MGIRFKKDKMQFLLLMLLGFIHSCIDYGNNQINFEREITTRIHKIKSERGVLILNNTFMLASSCPLVYHKYFPDWIVEDTSNLVFSSKNSVFIPTIYDIKPPYKLIKKKNTDFFKVVKNRDTLTFKLIDF